MGEAAAFAMGFAGGTDIAAMEQEPIMGGGYKIGGDMALELHLYAIGRRTGLGYQTEAVADAEDVSVDGEGGLTEGDGLDDIGGLAPYSGDLGEFFQGGRHLTAEAFHEGLAESHEVLGFVVGVTHTLNVFIDHFRCSNSQGFGGRIIVEEAWRDLVDALVGALCGEHNSYEEFKRIGIVEFGFGGFHRTLEKLQYGLVSFFFSHNRLEDWAGL